MRILALNHLLTEFCEQGRSEAGSVLRLYCGEDEAIEKLMICLEVHKTRMMQVSSHHQEGSSARNVWVPRS